MGEATFCFHDELIDFLPKKLRGRSVQYQLNGPVSVKHCIEALGVPHPEVALILANGSSVLFSYPVQEGDHLDVYSHNHGIEVNPSITLHSPLLIPPLFVLDNHLGQLATYMRLLGFDTSYRNDFQDEELAALSGRGGRVLLTRDRRLLMRRAVEHGYWLRSKDPRQQLTEVLDRFQLRAQIRPWHRCLRCNGRLLPVDKEAVLDRLEPKTKLYYHEFHMCQDCHQIYWKGSHYSHMQTFLETLA